MSHVSTDPIADMLTRIRNAINVRKQEVLMPHSKLKQSVAQVLADTKFIEDVSVVDASVGKTLKIVINSGDTNPRITEIVKMSTPGRRMYANVKDIPTVKQGRGLVIVSTSQGLMTGTEAKNKRLGGELICKVY